MNAIHSALLVEDHDLTLSALQDLLHRGLGIDTVRAARTAEGATEILRKEQFQLIISDYQLDGMSGVQLLELMRSNGDSTPMILLSGVPDGAAVRRALCHTHVCFLPKPFAVAELTSAMKQLSAA